MKKLREEVGDKVSNLIVDNAKILLRHYLVLKYQFKNTEFWGEDAFHQWDLDIARCREYIAKYK